MDENGKKRLHIPLIDLSDATKRTRWLLRVVSIALALTLWFFVGWDGASDDPRTKELTVPLLYLDVPDGYSISNRVRNITVLMEGSVELLALLDRNAVTASVSLQELRPGKYRLPVHVDSPERVRILSYSPQVVEFELYRMIERTLKPLLEYDDDDLSDDISLTEIVFEPAEVVVKGSETDVMTVRHAVVRPRVEDLTAHYALDLPVVLIGADDAEIAGLEIVPRQVRLSVRVAESTEEIRVPVNVPIRGVPGNGLNVDTVVVSPDVVALRGTRTALANIAELTLGPIDVTGHTDDMVVDIPLDAPAPGITIANADSVRVRIQLHSSVETRTFVGVPIAVTGSGAFEDWQVAPAVANVMVERSVTSTEPFDMSKPPFELYVDVTNIVANHLVLPVLVRNVHDDMRVIRIEPQQVTISAVRD